MEQLLFLVFILFSVGSALLEQRKRRRRQQEQAERRQREGQQTPQQQASNTETRPSLEEVEPVPSRPPHRSSPAPRPQRRERPVTPQPAGGSRETDEQESGWPFELQLPQRIDVQDLLDLQNLQAEREALAAERRALQEERRALQAAKRAQPAAEKSRQSVADLIRARAEQQRTSRKPRSGELIVGRWKLDPHKARDAIVYSEILGRPRAERVHEEAGFTR